MVSHGIPLERKGGDGEKQGIHNAAGTESMKMVYGGKQSGMETT